MDDQRGVRERTEQDDDVEKQIERERISRTNKLETSVLDYRADSADPERVSAELPPAWDTSPSLWTVGYEPVGETSIGVEHERRASSRWARFRVPAMKLALHQEGRHPSDGDQSRRLAELDKKRITQGLCSALDVTGHHQTEAVRAMLLLDLTVFGNQKRIERIALAVIELIVDYDRRYRRRDPNASRLGENPEFKYLAREVGLIPGKIQLSRKVKEQLIDDGFFEPGAPGLSRCKDVYFSKTEDPRSGETRWIVTPRRIDAPKVASLPCIRHPEEEVDVADDP